MAKSAYPKVVTKPTGKTGGNNKSVKAVTTPTKSGKKNPSAKVKPAK